MKLFKALGLATLAQGAPVDEAQRDVSADSKRVDCHPEGGATEASCWARGCTWAPGERGAPWCFYPENYKHYNQVGDVIDTELEQNGQMVQAKIFNLQRDTGAIFIPEYIEQIEKLQVQVTFQCNDAVRIKIIDAEKERYEVPVPVGSGDEKASWLDKDGNPAQQYEIETNASPFWIKVIRREDEQVVFDTSAGPILYYNQFLQLTTYRPTEYIYGFGETEHASFKYDTEWSQMGMWARDNGVGIGSNLYGVQPYHIAMENSGKASGVLFFNSNAQEVAVSPHPHVTYRTIGGVLDFLVFMGPTVEDVTKEYTQYLGRSPMFPYWSLGFQLCRYGYNSLEEVERVVEENRAAGIPYDVQYGDIDYMERQLDFTIELGSNFDGLKEYVHKMRTEYNMRYIPILDPAISIDDQGEGAWKDPITGEDYASHTRALAADVYIRGEDGELETGKVWPYKPGIYLDDIVQDDNGWDENVGKYHSRVAFPDFFKNETYTWWLDEMERFRHAMYPESDAVRGLEYDGIWIDMNEPASFTAGRPGPDGYTQGRNGCVRDPHHLNFPPYVPVSLNEGKNGVGLFEKTICMNSIQQNPLTGNDEYHYNVHSLYGYSEGQPTLDACQEVTGKRCIVVSRSTFPGAQKTIGHWLGDNTSMWRHVKHSVIGVIEFSLFGFPYTGPDTCGFFNDSNEELCKRWMQVGSFFTYSRNHNGITFRRQDPAAWGTQFAAGARATLLERYRLLPYLYTLTYRSHTRGDTVVRSMLANFPTDKETWTNDEQMMWGSGLMIAPVLYEQTFVVNTYFPDQRWYNYYNGDEIETRGGYQQINAPLDFIPLFLKGGEILPMQQPDVTTMDSRMNNLGLLISLDDNNEASGELYWDEGNSIDPVENGQYTLVQFDYKNGHLRSNVKLAAVTTETHENSGETTELVFTHLKINGLKQPITRIMVNGEELPNTAWQQNRNYRLEILDNESSFRLPIGEQFDIFIEVNDESSRVDCMPGGGDQSACEAKGCKWESSNTAGVPWCFHTSRSPYGFNADSQDDVTMSGNSLDLDLTNKVSDGSYSTPIANAKFQARQINKSQVRFKLTDADNERWEVPDEALVYPNEAGEQTENDFNIVTGDKNGFYFKVEKDGKTLIDSSHGPIIFEDQYVEVSLELGSYNCYGLGEHNHRRFRHALNWQKWAMFTRDVAPIDEWNFYGQHPFIMCVNDDHVFALYMHNSNAQEFILSPKPALTWRSIGGVIDITFFYSKTPEEMVQLYTSTIGRPFLPPRWSLGFQLSRWGYDTLEKMDQVVQDMFEAEIPYDAQYGDIDYMDRKRDFTYDPVGFKGLPDWIEDLHDRGMHYITILDPALQNKLDWNADTNFDKDEYISFWNGDQQENWNGQKGIWIRDSDGNPVQAEVWPGPTYFPDFTDLENTGKWWTHECDVLHSETGITYDALWIDMNEPANFQTDGGNLTCYGNLNFPPYTPNILNADEGLYIKTICMDNEQKWGKHYNTHSLYGHSMAIVTHKTLEDLFPDRRSFVLTRSQFAGTGKYAGHWLGDNQSHWPNLGWSIIGMLEYSLFGFSYTGADICGFWFNATESMCSRWSQLGAFYPYSRNHNGIGWRDQHPPALGELVTESAKTALTTRYTLLPTLYTLMYESTAFGSTTVRSLMAEFQSDRNARDCSDQFLWGRGFMIAPILEDNSNSRGVYFPGSKWYNYYNNKEIQGGTFQQVNALDTEIPLFVRDDTILVEQKPELTTTAQAENDMTMKIFTSGSSQVTGALFWDNGQARLEDSEFLYMQYELNRSGSSGTLTASCSNCSAQTVTLANINFYGSEVTSAQLNGEDLTISNNSLQLSGVSISTEWTISLTFA